MRLAALAALLILAGCGSQGPAAQVSTAPIPLAGLCPKVDDWTKEQLGQLRAQLAPIEDGTPVIKMALEWKRLRGDAQACASQP